MSYQTLYMICTFSVGMLAVLLMVFAYLSYAIDQDETAARERIAQVDGLHRQIQTLQKQLQIAGVYNRSLQSYVTRMNDTPVVRSEHSNSVTKVGG